MNNELDEIRQLIDETDDRIRELFVKRMELAARVASVKMKTKDAVYKPDREASVIERRAEQVEPDLGGAYCALLRKMMRLSREYQYRLILKEEECFPFPFRNAMQPPKTVALTDNGRFFMHAFLDAGFFTESAHLRRAENRREVCRITASKMADAGAALICRDTDCRLTGSDICETKLDELLFRYNLYISRHIDLKTGPGLMKAVLFGRELNVLEEHNRLRIIFGVEDRAGALAEVLSVIADYGVDITDISFFSSGFLKEENCCVAELALNLQKEESRALIWQLSCETLNLRILGSYDGSMNKSLT